MSRTTIRRNRLPAIRHQIRQKAARAVKKAVLDIEGHTKASMAEAKSGRMYGEHQASAPGEAPAIDLGLLVNSIQGEMVGELSGVVYTDKEYGPPLEFGTHRIAPRPFFGPAAEAVRPSFEQSIRNLIDG